MRAVSQNRAGLRPRTADPGGALPEGGAHSVVSSPCSAWPWPAWTHPPTSPPPSGRRCNHSPLGTRRVPEAQCGPPLGAYPLFPGGPGPVIALTGPWGRGSLVLVHMSQVSREETSGTATSHSLGLVSTPHKPLPALSWHHQPEAPGSCTALVSAAPPVPAHPQPTADPPSRPRAGAGVCLSRCRGQQPGHRGRGSPPTPPHPELGLAPAVHEPSVTVTRRSSCPPCLPTAEGGTERPGWQSPAHPPGAGARLPPSLRARRQEGQKEPGLWSQAGLSLNSGFVLTLLGLDLGDFTFLSLGLSTCKMGSVLPLFQMGWGKQLNPYTRRLHRARHTVDT